MALATGVRRAANYLLDNSIPIESQNRIGTKNGRTAGEVDLETDNALVEVTTSPDGKMKQLKELRDNAALNPSGKPVILFAPKYVGHAAKFAESNGFIVVRSLDELKNALHRLGN